MKLVSGLAVLAVSALALSACSSSDAYCDAVADADLELVLETGDFTDRSTVERALAEAKELVAAAPDDLRPAWQAVLDGIAASATAMENTGRRDKPLDLSVQQAAASAIGQMAQAENAIDTDLVERCGFGLRE